MSKAHVTDCRLGGRDAAELRGNPRCLVPWPDEEGGGWAAGCKSGHDLRWRIRDGHQGFLGRPLSAGCAEPALQHQQRAIPIPWSIGVGVATSCASPFLVFVSTSIRVGASRVPLLPSHQRRCRPQELAWHAGKHPHTGRRFKRMS